MVRDFDGKVPSTVAHLRSLPGIGEYSAASIASFAFKAPVIVLDTNVGRVFSRCVAGKRLSDLELRELSAGLAVMSNSAVVNQRLLDFGAKYCRATPQCEECPAKKFCAWQRVGGDDPAKNSSKVSKPQSAFAGSRRQVRGKILKALGEGPTSIAALQARISDERCLEVLDELVGEGLVEKFKRSVRLHGDER